MVYQKHRRHEPPPLANHDQMVHFGSVQQWNSGELYVGAPHRACYLEQNHRDVYRSQHASAPKQVETQQELEALISTSFVSYEY